MKLQNLLYVPLALLVACSEGKGELSKKGEAALAPIRGAYKVACEAGARDLLEGYQLEKNKALLEAGCDTTCEEWSCELGFLGRNYKAKIKKGDCECKE